MFSVLLSPKTHRVVFFSIPTHIHFYRERAPAHVRTHNHSDFSFGHDWKEDHDGSVYRNQFNETKKNSMLMFSLLIMSCTRLNYILDFGVPWLWETEANDMESSEYNLIWRFVACFFLSYSNCYLLSFLAVIWALFAATPSSSLYTDCVIYFQFDRGFVLLRIFHHPKISLSHLIESACSVIVPHHHS